MTSRRAPAWLVLPFLTLVVGAVATAAPVRAQDRCDGVWVVVDATALGAGETTRCASGDPGSGLEALTAAGHRYTFVPRQPGLVCTIDRRPDPCNGAPQDAYWSYWHAPAGGDWTYATRGAGNRDPEPGTVEGWAFGAGDPPASPPPASAPQPQPEPEPTAAPAPPSEPASDAGPAPASDPDTAQTGSAPGGSARTTTDDGAVAAAAPPSPSPSTPPTRPDASPVPSPSPVVSPTATLEPVPGELPSPGPDVVETTPPGRPIGLILGGILIAVVAAAAAIRARRRTDGRS